MSGIQYSVTQSDKHLLQILALQKRNLPQSLSEIERNEQGFVTVDHSFELLKRMHQAHPHIIALDNNQIIGYALVMLPSFREDIEILIPMFDQIDCELARQDLTHKYVVMGQVCVDKPYRGKGVFKNLYNHMQLIVSPNYPYCITEVDPLNTRSVRAHEKIGFELLNSYYDPTGRHWHLIIWYWV